MSLETSLLGPGFSVTESHRKAHPEEEYLRICNDFMRPYLLTDDLVAYVPAALGDIKRGELVAVIYRSAGKLQHYVGAFSRIERGRVILKIADGLNDFKKHNYPFMSKIEGRIIRVRDTSLIGRVKWMVHSHVSPAYETNRRREWVWMYGKAFTRDHFGKTFGQLKAEGRVCGLPPERRPIYS